MKGKGWTRTSATWGKTLQCPDCGTPMSLLEQIPTRVVYLCPVCYPDDPRHAALELRERGGS